MTEKTPYDFIVDLAAHLRSEGRFETSNRLITAHEGIFNATELFSMWRHEVEKVLELPELSDATQLAAITAWNYFSDFLD